MPALPQYAQGVRGELFRAFWKQDVCVRATAAVCWTMATAGCVPEPGAQMVGPQTATMAALRTPPDGICAAVPVQGAYTGIATCLVIGMPQTLYDDTTSRLKTVITGIANAPIADVDNWQLEAFRDGQPITKEMLKGSLLPGVDCNAGHCKTSSASSIAWSTPWTPGTYTFRYTFALQTSLVATNTITLRP